MYVRLTLGHTIYYGLCRYTCVHACLDTSIPPILLVANFVYNLIFWEISFSILPAGSPKE